MSEKIYALLLRLYPADFRRMYGDEALQLVRDRMRDEQGVWAKARLWWDLLADFAATAPREYGNVPAQLAGAAAGQRVGGGPSFWILEDEPMRAGTWVWASVFSLLLVGTSAVMMDHAGGHPLGSFRGAGRDAAGQVRWTPKQSGAGMPQGDSDVELVGSGGLRSQTPKPGSASDVTRVVAAQTTLDDAERQRVVDAVTANLRQHYVDPGAAQRMADALQAREQRGDYKGATHGPEFADLLTRELREVSHDADVGVVYSADPLRSGPAAPSPEAQERYRKMMQEMDCTFSKVEMLPHNVGYVKLDAFPQTAVCEAAAEAAMARVNGASALIVDLRDNGGGFQDMVNLIAGYLFARPTFVYSPRGDGGFTHPVAGNRLADKPVYVLTSHTTISAAEDFCYNLKMLKRATFVGETTRGSAHAGAFYRIDDHFGMGMPGVKVVNPYGTSDWEGVGVEPDVKVNAADALPVAEKLAEEKVQRQ
ncbi:MAG: S41 family peptidase [Terracidiphilus sp.]|nr:S41 family peptidase [Terracidiphilus sp.]